MPASPGAGAPSLCAIRLQTATRVIHGRWFVVAVSILVMVVSAGAYSFSVYSQKLKSALAINQENLNLIANSKDLGVNFGLVSGLLFDYWSPAGVLLIGALETAAGYSLAWLSVTNRIPSSLWQMCLFLFVGANSQAMLNTAVLVHCVKLFPASKGAIIGLMKGYIGISGAILIQIYITISGAARPESFMLMLVWLPSSVAVLAMVVFRPLKPYRGAPDGKYFYWLLALGFLLAFYLMGVSVTQNMVKVGTTSERVIGTLLMVLIFIPLAGITYRAEVFGTKTGEDSNSSLSTQNFIRGDTESAPGSQKLFVTGQIQNPSKSQTLDGRLDELPDPKPSTDDVKTPKAWPRRGEDHTILQTYRALDFWLLFVATTFGIGAGLTVTDNMGQLGLSLGYSSANVRTFVSLVSIWNAIGRWVGGFVSDLLLRHYGTSRALFLVIMMTLMAMAFLLVAVNVPGCLYFGSIFLGLSFGAQYPLYATIVADIFGLKYYATLYSSIGLASPVGMYVLSIPLVGRFYDAEAKLEAGVRDVTNRNSSLECHGSSCFGRSLLILMGVTLGAAVCAMALWFRTRHLYVEVYEGYQSGKFGEQSKRAETETEAEVEKGERSVDNH